jgi:hypothetical protein
MAFKGKEPPNLGTPKPVNASVACGKCHDDIRRPFSVSMHQERGGLSCILCHDKHAIKPANLDEVTPNYCNSQCHSYTHGNASIQALRQTIITADHGLAEAESVYRQLAQQDILSFSLEQLLINIKEAHLQLKNQFHTFDLQTINEKAVHLLALKKDILDKTESIKQSKRSQNTQKIVGFIFVLLFLVCAAICWHYSNN